MTKQSRQQVSRLREQAAADAARDGETKRRAAGEPSSQMERAEIVSGRWLVKAILITLIAAGGALYLTVCLLFYQGQWQFTFSPSGKARNIDLFAGSWAKRTGPAPAHAAAPANVEALAASSGLPITDVRFDYTEEGVARLDGWWIPATNESAGGTASKNFAASKLVVLFCPNGRTKLPENIAAFRAFHALGLSIFAFDYRGFGASQSGHPSQTKAYADGLAALHYLTGIRHIDQQRIVLYGADLGAAVAAQIAYQSPQIAGVVLENPQPSLAKQVKREQHIHLLPMWLVFTERFDISGIVPSLKMPKLVIATPAQPEYVSGATAVWRQSATPKEMVRVNPPEGAALYSRPEWRHAVSSFVNALASNPAHHRDDRPWLG